MITVTFNYEASMYDFLEQLKEQYDSIDYWIDHLVNGQYQLTYRIRNI